MSSSYLIAGLLGLNVTLFVLWLALRRGWAAVLLGRPPDWHHATSPPVPRLGGAALALAFLAVELYAVTVHPALHASPPFREYVVCGSLAMFALGFWDDVRPLGALEKLLGQVIVATAICFSGAQFEVLNLPFAGIELQLVKPIGFVVTVIWLVGFTNLINLTDGLDGHAGGICLFLMILFSVIGHPVGGAGLLAPGMVGALVGFLIFNLPPARLYLGDGGAYLLGFQSAVYSIIGSEQGADFGALSAPLFLLILPVTDAVLTIVRRGLRGLPLFRPDRQHLHHRLAGNGASITRVVLFLYGLNLVFFLAALLAYWSDGRSVPFLCAATILVLLICAMSCNFSRRWLAVHRVVWSSLRMRKQIQHALGLGRWMNLESRRCSSLHELWQILIFAAERLGFEGLTLTLRNQRHCWHRQPGSPGGARRQFGLPDGHFGRLEFAAPACALGGPGRQRPCEITLRCRVRPNGCLANQKLFDTISELLAEAWSKSAQQRGNGHSSTAVPGYKPKTRKCSASVHAVRSYGLVWLAFLLESGALAQSLIGASEIQRVLEKAPAAELPALSAALAAKGVAQGRVALAAEVVSCAVRINPAACVAVVGAVSRTKPEVAGLISETAARAQSTLAPEIARAAAAAAPFQAGEIVTRVGAVVPEDIRRIALAAFETAPKSGIDILRAIGTVDLKLRPYLEREITKCAGIVRSVSRCLDRAEAAQSRDAASLLAEGGHNPGDPAPAVSMPHKPIGPKPPRGEDHPPGGRNYARP